jgi:hypothetical protein
VYYRSCEAFQGAKGKEFAKDSAEFWQTPVKGHTKLIGITQPGQKTLKPGEDPDWSDTEGVNAQTKKNKRKLGFPLDWFPI